MAVSGNDAFRDSEYSAPVTYHAASAGPITATIPEVLSGVENTVYSVKGIVCATAPTSFLLTDSSGSYLYVYAQMEHGLVIGDEAKVVGTKVTYCNISELKSVQSIERLSQNNELNQPIYGTQADKDFFVAQLQNFTQGAYITFTAPITVSGNYLNIAIEGLDGAMVSLVPNGDTFEDGQVYEITGYLIYITGSNTKYITVLSTHVRPTLVEPVKCLICGGDASVGAHGECPDCDGYLCDGNDHTHDSTYCHVCGEDLSIGNHEEMPCGHRACEKGEHYLCPNCQGYLCQGSHKTLACGHTACQYGDHQPCTTCNGYLCQGAHDPLPCGHLHCQEGQHYGCGVCGNYLCYGDHSEMPCGHKQCASGDHSYCRFCDSYLCNGTDHSLMECGQHHACEGNVHHQCTVCGGYVCDGNDHTHAPVAEECPYCGGYLLEGNHDLLECHHHACEVGYHHQCPGCMNFICHTSEEEHMPCDHCGNLLCQGSHDECRENACPACGTIGATHETLACGHYICQAADADHLECTGCGGYRCDGGDHYPCHVCGLPICQGDHAHEDVTSTCPGCGEPGIVHELIIVDGSYLYSCQVSPDDYTCPGCGEAGIVHERLEDGSYSCQAGPDGDNCPICGGSGTAEEHWLMDCGHCYAIPGNHDRCGYCGNFFCHPDADHSNCGTPIVSCPGCGESGIVHELIIVDGSYLYSCQVSPDDNSCPACGMTGDSHELLDCGHFACEEGNHTLCIYCQTYLCRGEHIDCGKELCEGCGEMIVFPEDHAIAECGNHRICEGGDHYMIHCFHYICDPGDHSMLDCGHHACWEGDHVYLPCGEHYACQYDNHEEHEIADCGHFGCAEGDHNPCEVCGGHVCEGDHSYANCWLNHRVCDGQNHERLDCGHFACEEGIHQYCETCGEGFICQGGHAMAECGHKECEGDRNHYMLECGHYACADGEHGIACGYCGQILCQGDHSACFCPACGGNIAEGNHFLYDCGHRACEGGIHVHCQRCGGFRCQGDHTNCNKDPHGCCAICGMSYRYDDIEHGRRECGHCLSVAGDHDRCEICGYFLCHDLYNHSNCDKNQDENCPVCGGALSQGNHAECPDCGGHFCDGNDHNHIPAVEICPGCGEEGITHSKYACDHYICEEGSHGACTSCGQFLCQSDMEHGLRPCGDHRYCEAVDISHEWCKACDSGYICDGGHTELECGHRVCEDGFHAQCRYCWGWACIGTHGFCEYCGGADCIDHHELYSCGNHAVCQYEPNENGECPVCSDPCYYGHSYEEIVIPPSCISEGITKLVCSVCGDTQILSQTAPNGVHSYNENGVCNNCGNMLTPNEHPTYEWIDGYLYFGEYPQTVKADDVAITNIKNDKGYYLGTDGEWYLKHTAQTYSDSTNNRFENGEYIVPDNEYYFKVEPLKWMVIESSGNTYSLVCVNIIETGAFNSLVNTTDYLGSEARTWLTGEFYANAFNATQKAMLNPVAVGTDNAANYVYDKAYLLTKPQAESLTQEQRTKYATDYARATGLANIESNSSAYNRGTALWWLRTPTGSYAGIVNPGGILGTWKVFDTWYGYVPGITVTLPN